MNTVNKLSGNNKPERQSWLRAFWNSLSNYTLAGPGALPTGQSGGVGRRASEEARAGDGSVRPVGTRAVEYSLPLRQVFWI